MKSIGSVLRARDNRSAMFRGVAAARAVAAANQILAENFGAAIAESAQAMYVKNSVLCIACLSTTVAQEIRLREATLLDAIASAVGSRAVIRIRYLF